MWSESHVVQISSKYVSDSLVARELWLRKQTSRLLRPRDRSFTAIIPRLPVNNSYCNIIIEVLNFTLRGRQQACDIDLPSPLTQCLNTCDTRRPQDHQNRSTHKLLKV